MQKVLKTALTLGFLLVCLGIHAQGNFLNNAFIPDDPPKFLIEYENSDQNEGKNEGSDDKSSNEPRTGVGFGVMTAVGPILPFGLGTHISLYHERILTLSAGYNFNFIFGHGFYGMTQIRFLEFLSLVSSYNRYMNFSDGSDNMLSFGVGFWGLHGFIANNKSQVGEPDEFLYLFYTPANWGTKNMVSLVDVIGRFSIAFGLSP